MYEEYLDQLTVDEIRKPLSQGGLVYRYDPREAPDGLLGVEGTFNVCSLWLVEELTRAGRRRLEEARLTPGGAFGPPDR
jgi:GH15 family glucan-1,4-alpha-glucosidase